MPGFCAATFQGVGVVVGSSCLLLIDESLGGQRLTGCQLEVLSCLSVDGNLRKARQILSHVEHQQGVFAQGLLDGITLHYLYSLGLLWTKLALGTFLYNHRVPNGRSGLLVF